MPIASAMLLRVSLAEVRYAQPEPSESKGHGSTLRTRQLSASRERESAARRASGYRLGGLDGLRALACIAVLMYHTWPTVMPGGFLGVDVFFVLSGFLITSLLIKDIRERGKVRLWRFWVRRWRRLFPAVATVVIVTAPIAALIDLNIIARLRSQVLGALTFTYNWVEIASDNSYFDHAYPRIFTNMWTLAVEQQFYVVWPLILIALAWVARSHQRRLYPLASRVVSAHTARSQGSSSDRSRSREHGSDRRMQDTSKQGAEGHIAASEPLPRWAVCVPLALAAASIILMVLFSHGQSDFTRAYMGTDSHSFGIMLGAALAMYHADALSPKRYGKDFFRNNFFGFLGWLALVFVLGSFFWMRDDWQATYPWLTLVVVLCSAWVINMMTASYQTGLSLATGLRVLLDTRALAWLGERSYGVYLWHWPILVMWWALVPNAPLWIGTLTVGAASIACAAWSYRYIENPMRYKGVWVTLRAWFKEWRKHIVGICVGVTLTVGLVIALLLAPSSTDVEQALSAHSNSAPRGAEGATGGSTPKAGEDGVAQADGQGEPPTGESEAAASSIGEQAAQQHQVPVSGENITMIGDSVVLAVQPEVENRWPGVVVDGEVSRSYIPIAGLIDTYKSQEQLGHYVVIGAANNSALGRDVIEEWLDQIGEDRVLVLITGHGNARTTWIADSNAAIGEAARLHSDRIVVADWGALADANPAVLYADGTHPNPEGVPVFADMLAKALDEAQDLGR